MRLQPKRAPDLLHGRTAQPARFRHVAAAPMRLPAGRLLQRPHDHLLHLLVADLPRRPRARLVVQPVEPLAHESAAPFAPRRLRHPQPPRDRCVWPEDIRLLKDGFTAQGRRTLVEGRSMWLGGGGVRDGANRARPPRYSVGSTEPVAASGVSPWPPTPPRRCRRGGGTSVQIGR